MRTAVAEATRARYEHAAACGEHIRMLRRERNLTLKDVAKGSGLPYQYLSRIERGEVNIPYETLAQIAQAMQVDMPRIVPAKVVMTPDDVKPLIDDCSPNVLSVVYFILTILK
jgi:transcriptional regulator with XRE-family HTH domain